MDNAQDPRMMGESIAQGLPGVGILQMLRKAGTQMPTSLDEIIKMLSSSFGTPRQPTYRNDEPLPRHGGMDANGQPIIIPPKSFWREDQNPPLVYDQNPNVESMRGLVPQGQTGTLAINNYIPPNQTGTLRIR